MLSDIRNDSDIEQLYIEYLVEHSGAEDPVLSIIDAHWDEKGGLMFQKQKEMMIPAMLSYVWEFLLDYDWSLIIKGKETKQISACQWHVDIGNGNIQVIEVTSHKESYSMQVKMTPKYHPHQSYDLWSLSLTEMESSTKLICSYEYHANSLKDCLFAFILHHEENMFEEVSNLLFDTIQKTLLSDLYG